MSQSIADLQNDIAATQAMIDRARAHLECYKHNMTVEDATQIRNALDDQQAELNRYRETLSYVLS